MGQEYSANIKNSTSKTVKVNLKDSTNREYVQIIQANEECKIVIPQGRFTITVYKQLSNKSGFESEESAKTSDRPSIYVYKNFVISENGEYLKIEQL